MVWKPVTTESRAKCLVEAVKRHTWVLGGVFERCQKLHGRGNKQSVLCTFF